MENFESKKLLIIRIFAILTDFSDSEHLLRQVDIKDLLHKEYGVECDRKAIVRNISFLNEAGYDVAETEKGYYLVDRKFEVGELRLLIDSVLSNKNINKTYTKDLIKKLAKEGGKYFRTYAANVEKQDDWNKKDLQDFFYNIEQLCGAIEDKKQVRFFYNWYGVDKKLHPRSEEKRIANPYRLLLKNGNYYLLCNYDNHDGHLFCRVDKMTEIEVLDTPVKPLNQVCGFENGINLAKMANRLPYMFDDKAEQIVFETTKKNSDLIGDVIDWFGKDVNIQKTSENSIRFTLLASPRAMRFWILQYGSSFKVLSPQSFVDTIKADIQEMRKLYE